MVKEGFPRASISARTEARRRDKVSPEPRPTERKRLTHIELTFTFLGVKSTDRERQRRTNGTRLFANGRPTNRRPTAAVSVRRFRMHQEELLASLLTSKRTDASADLESIRGGIRHFCFPFVLGF